MRAVKWTAQTIALIGFGIILSPGLVCFALMYLGDRMERRRERVNG